jgi:hypothetical protein
LDGSTARHHEGFNAWLFRVACLWGTSDRKSARKRRIRVIRAPPSPTIVDASNAPDDSQSRPSSFLRLIEPAEVFIQAGAELLGKLHAGGAGGLRDRTLLADRLLVDSAADERKC